MRKLRVNERETRRKTCRRGQSRQMIFWSSIACLYTRESSIIFHLLFPFEWVHEKNHKFHEKQVIIKCMRSPSRFRSCFSVFDPFLYFLYFWWCTQISPAFLLASNWERSSVSKRLMIKWSNSDHHHGLTSRLSLFSISISTRTRRDREKYLSLLLSMKRDATKEHVIGELNDPFMHHDHFD